MKGRSSIPGAQSSAAAVLLSPWIVSDLSHKPDIQNKHEDNMIVDGLKGPSAVTGERVQWSTTAPP